MKDNGVINYALRGEMGFAMQWKFKIMTKFCLGNKPDIRANGNVMIILEIPKYQNFKLYFDRFYTSVYLAIFVGKNWIQCAGTI